LANKRELPWRNTTDPYAIWVSEVMLQQTQAAVVIPYFERWMATFPSVQALAEAPLDKVIKAWEGLGYYSRARNLHEGAKWISNELDGRLPDCEEGLARIKGLGPYTIGAILSFAFHQKKAAVDGNVMRVLSRFFHIEEDISKSATQKKLRGLAESLLPDEEPWAVAEGLIELGATVCQKKARCGECPLKSACLSFRHQSMDRLPLNGKKIKTEQLYRAVAIIEHGGCYLVKKGQKGKIMSDLTEFPYLEIPHDRGISIPSFVSLIHKEWGLTVQALGPLETVIHGFTRFQARLDPVRFQCLVRQPMLGFEWESIETLQQRAFSSGHRRIWQMISQ